MRTFRISEEGHTPGPWSYEADSLRDGEANARLIAAAPEMLEALLDLVTCHAFNGEVFDKDKESHKRWTLARAVIEKARGY